MAQRYLFPRPAHHARRRAADPALLRRPAARLDHRWCRTGPSTPRPQYNPDSQPDRALARRLSLFARAVSDRQPDLPPGARPVRAGRARLAVAGLRAAARRASGERAAAAAAAAARSTASAASTTAPATAGSPIRSSASSTTPAAGSAGSSSSGCRPAAAKRRRACCSSWNWSACRGSARIRCKVLKDNVPGYQLLREERTTTSPFTPYD